MDATGGGRRPLITRELHGLNRLRAIVRAIEAVITDAVVGLLWNDNSAVHRGFSDSRRGRGKTAILDFFTAAGLKAIVCGHQSLEGVQANVGMNRVTVFGSANCGGDNRCGVLFIGGIINLIRWSGGSSEIVILRPSVNVLPATQVLTSPEPSHV